MRARRWGSWPSWSEWELVLSTHLLERMRDRDFTEEDLRSMMEGAYRVRPGGTVLRWIIETGHASRPWRVVVELDPTERLVIVVTAYAVEGP